MKTFFLISTAILTAGTLPLAAQAVGGDSIINRDITIEREYRPVIEDAGKINTQPQLAEPNVTRMTPRYTTDFSKPLQMDRNIHYLDAAELEHQREPGKEGFARAGFGTGFNSLADFAYPLLKRPDMKLDFLLNHYGLFNRKAHATTQGALAFTKNFRALDLFAGVDGGHEYYKYYGDLFGFDHLALDRDALASRFPSLVLPPAHNHLWRMNAHAGLHSTDRDALRYGVRVDYDLFNSRQGVTEHGLTVKANLDGEVGGNRLGVDIRSQSLFYNTIVSGAYFDNYSLLAVNPYYAFEREAFDLRLGLSAALAFYDGAMFAPALDVRFDWRAVPRWLDVYAGIGGGYEANALTDIYRENPFIAPAAQVGNTYTPVDASVGFKVKPVAGLLVDAFVNYHYREQYFFVNQAVFDEGAPSPAAEPLPPFYPFVCYGSLFDVRTENVGLLRVGGRVSYNYHDRLSVRLSGAYNHWYMGDMDYAWHMPSWEAAAHVNARITPKLSAYVTADLSGGRHAFPAAVLPAQVDINLGASYAFLDWLSAFVKVNNLINSKYQLWAGYEAQGFNVMAGAAFSF